MLILFILNVCEVFQNLTLLISDGPVLVGAFAV